MSTRWYWPCARLPFGRSQNKPSVAHKLSGANVKTSSRPAATIFCFYSPDPPNDIWDRLVGMIASTCIEATGRYGMELGYDVMLVRDATAAFSLEAMHAAHEINRPTLAHV